MAYPKAGVPELPADMVPSVLLEAPLVPGYHIVRDGGFDLDGLVLKSTVLEEELSHEDGAREGLVSEAHCARSEESKKRHGDHFIPPPPALSAVDRCADDDFKTTHPPTFAFKTREQRPIGMSYSHWIRRQRKDHKRMELGKADTSHALRKVVVPSLESAVHRTLDIESLPATVGGYGAKVRRREFTDCRTLDEVKAAGMEVFAWNGSDPIPWVDQKGRVFMVLAGQPGGTSYQDAVKEMYNAMAEESKAATFTPGQICHRRGRYPVINVGVTHGMGTQRPTYLDNRSLNGIADNLLANKSIQRIATYASTAFDLWEPNVHAYYKNKLDALFEHSPHLRRIFPDSVFPACAFNFGPNACTEPHTDPKNSPTGVCTVTPSGNFDATKGGHLVLWELGVAIEFPAGSTILLPSATITHSNLRIQEHETRASFTQYCSGGLFRWVDYGFQKESDLRINDPSRYEIIVTEREGRWKTNLEMLSTLKDLKSNGKVI